MKRVIIYARVSTREQNPDMQLLDLRTYAEARKLQVVQEYVDYASGSKSDRENYIRLFNDVRKRKEPGGPFTIYSYRIDLTGFAKAHLTE